MRGVILIDQDWIPVLRRGTDPLDSMNYFARNRLRRLSSAATLQLGDVISMRVPNDRIRLADRIEIFGEIVGDLIGAGTVGAGDLTINAYRCPGGDIVNIEPVAFDTKTVPSSTQPTGGTYWSARLANPVPYVAAGTWIMGPGWFDNGTEIWYDTAGKTNLMGRVHSPLSASVSNIFRLFHVMTIENQIPDPLTTLSVGIRTPAGVYIPLFDGPIRHINAPAILRPVASGEIPTGCILEYVAGPGVQHAELSVADLRAVKPCVFNYSWDLATVGEGLALTFNPTVDMEGGNCYFWCGYRRWRNEGP